MKRFCTLLILFFFVVNFKLIAQQENSNLFEIKLPESWKDKRKFTFKLAEIIKAHIPQLETKNECVDCNAGYHVSFVISDPIIDYSYPNPLSSNEFTTLYRFWAFMEVSDSNNRVFHRLILNDTSVTHIFKYKYFGRGSILAPVQSSIAAINKLPGLSNGQRDIVIDRNALNDNLNRAERPLYSSDQYLNAGASQSALIPRQTDIWNEVENVIREFDLKKFVASKNLN